MGLIYWTQKILYVDTFERVDSNGGLFMAEEMTATSTSTSQDVQNASQETQTNDATNNATVNEKDAQSTKNTSQELSIEELIQKAVDRATNKLGNDNKKLRESLTKLQKEKLSADELKAIELQEKEADIADREAKLQEKINREFALKAIKDAGLDDGGSNSLKLIDFKGEKHGNLQNLRSFQNG